MVHNITTAGSLSTGRRLDDSNRYTTTNGDAEETENRYIRNLDSKLRGRWVAIKHSLRYRKHHQEC